MVIEKHSKVGVEGIRIVPNEWSADVNGFFDCTDSIRVTAEVSEPAGEPVERVSQVSVVSSGMVFDELSAYVDSLLDCVESILSSSSVVQMARDIV